MVQKKDLLQHSAKQVNETDKRAKALNQLKIEFNMTCPVF